MKRISLTAWIFIAMVVGIVLGVVVPDFAKELGPLSNIFLRLIKSIVAPLLFGTLVYGIAGHGHAGSMGRIGIKAMSYFWAVTTIALAIGLITVNLVKPGQGLNLKVTEADSKVATAAPSLASTLEHTFPSSIIDAMAKGEVLQIVVFSFMFGAACAGVGVRGKPMVEFCESLAEVMFRYTNYVMYLAPMGVGAAMAVTIGSKGIGVLLSLGKLVLTVYGALIFFIVVVLGTIIVIARIPMKRFIDAVKEPYILAFSTASSEAALPGALKNMEAFGVPKHIVAFVLPLGYSFNLDGSTLYLAFASVFVAQAAGIDLPISTQIVMMLTLMLTSKGVAAVPRASLVVLTATLTTFHLPMEGIAVLLGVDALLDMARTSVNLLGNCLASAVVARWEGIEFEKS